MLAKNAKSALNGPGSLSSLRQLINSETEFAKASQGHADEFIVMDSDVIINLITIFPAPEY